MNRTNQPIIRRYKKVQAAEEAGGGWKIALADFMCALSIVFFALWAISQSDEKELAAMADHFKGESMTELKTISLIDTTYVKIEKLLDKAGIVVTLEKNSRGITIKFDSESLFESGSDKLKKRAQEAISTLSMETHKTGLFYHVYGYTDNVPVRKGAKFSNNLELSVLRSVAAAKSLMEGGASSNKITIHGEGLLNPESKDDTPDGRAKNRRVELFLTYSSAHNKVYTNNVEYTPTNDLILKDGELLFDKQGNPIRKENEPQ
ncbi:flagellar motor protein MotB [Vibrio alginolyticus]|uniref:OmpA/MotB family protein n=1 Tax=Vibrio alginolyticus TaxID=663 RepID=UPI0006CA6DF3|nr:OmpA family protein [Vibrio alginolyticus]